MPPPDTRKMSRMHVVRQKLDHIVERSIDYHGLINFSVADLPYKAESVPRRPWRVGSPAISSNSGPGKPVVLVSLA